MITGTIHWALSQKGFLFKGEEIMKKLLLSIALVYVGI
jgi:hypothetical protein